MDSFEPTHSNPKAHPEKLIIHIDMDCFYAAVEMRDRPELKHRPIAIGGKSPRSVLCTANYPARKFGVRAAIPTSMALKLCPELIVIAPDFKKYKQASQEIHQIFKMFTRSIQPLSLDEAYLDVTQFAKMHDQSGLQIATLIKELIFKRTHLTASAGISSKKYLAKIASDWKKPNGIYEIKDHQIAEFLAPLDIKYLPGVGPVTLNKLNQLGHKTCSDLAQSDPLELVLQFGKYGKRLYELAREIDEGQVKTSSEAKSLSIENTFKQDLNLEQLLLEIPEITKEFFYRFVSSQKKRQKRGKSPYGPKALFVKIKLPNHQKKSLERSLMEQPELAHALSNLQYIDNITKENIEKSYQDILEVLEPIFYKFTRELFLRFGNPKIRLFGLGMRYHDNKKELDQMGHFDQLSFDCF